MAWKITYYNTTVQEAIRKWPKKLIAKYAKVTSLVEQFGPNLGMPFTKSLGKGLFEIRIKAQEGIGRAFFCTIIDNEIVILHAFIKKTQKTPHKTIDIALERLKEVKSND